MIIGFLKASLEVRASVRTLPVRFLAGQLIGLWVYKIAYVTRCTYYANRLAVKYLRKLLIQISI